MQMAQKGKNGRTFAFGQELWYTRKKKKGRMQQNKKIPERFRVRESFGGDDQI